MRSASRSSAISPSKSPLLSERDAEVHVRHVIVRVQAQRFALFGDGIRPIRPAVPKRHAPRLTA